MEGPNKFEVKQPNRILVEIEDFEKDECEPMFNGLTVLLLAF